MASPLRDAMDAVPGGLTRESILSAISTPMRRRAVSVPSWGGTVFVRELSGADFEAAMDALPSDAPAAERLARLCVLCCCDSDGASIFESRDVEKLLSGPLGPVMAVGTAASELNHMGDDSGN